jgi:hypothetical protein
VTAVVLCLLAKAPAPGAVKTRLCPPLSAERAAALTSAFIADTWRALGRVAGARRVLVYTGDRRRFPPALAGAEAWPQCAGDLGARIEHAARRALTVASRVVVVGGDAPALPPALVERAAASLASSDAVLGPALDGGYYLIGLQRCEPGLLAELPWSAETTLAASRARLHARGYRVVELPPWFDVDDGAGLALLELALRARWIDAPATRAALGERA